MIPASHPLRSAALILGAATSLLAARAASPVFDWPQHDSTRPKPPIIEPGSASTQDQPGRPPSDATVLFDGSSLQGWTALDGSAAKWVIKEGVLECVQDSGYIRTLQAFGDCQLHVEWAAPVPAQGTSQGRGNSGVFLMGLYEVQVLDSYQNVTYADGQAGAAYGQYPPLVNAARPPGQWQIYDIVFTRPRFGDDGKVASPARLTVFHNGVLVQNNVELVGPTGWLQRDPYRLHEDKLPISLQDHGNPVRYRNLWVRELGADAKRKEFVYDNASLDLVAGNYRADDGLRLKVERQGRILHGSISFPGRTMNFSMHAESRTRYFVRSFDGEFNFKLGADGKVESGTVRVGPDERAIRRE